MIRVAVVGHVEWVEFVPVERFPGPGDVVHADGAFARAAGGGGVVAAVLADLGAEVDFFCALGRDPLGRAAAAQLAERGVHTHVAWREQPTRRRSRCSTGAESARSSQLANVCNRSAPTHSNGSACGTQKASTSPLEIPTRSSVHARRGCSLPRPALARRSTREGRSSTRSCTARGDDDESAWARRVEDRARLLVETDGVNGGRCGASPHGSWQAVPLPGPPGDTYGCGDSFAAAFTFGLASGESVSEAAAVGARWGARALTRAGAPVRVGDLGGRSLATPRRGGRRGPLGSGAIFASPLATRAAAVRC